jgi:flagellar biosynthesis/type III secretory pathway protein FliH
MSFHLALADTCSLLASDRPIIKAKERLVFQDAIALLSETKRLRDQANADATAARDTARREALDEARATVQSTIVAALADMSQTIEAHASSRRSDIAEAAFAAARAIVGDLDDANVLQRIVDHTLARLDTDMPLTIEVAPALAADLRTHLTTLTHVTVIENPDLASTDCHILTRSGRIVASLSVQFDALAARWGLSNAS